MRLTALIFLLFLGAAWSLDRLFPPDLSRLGVTGTEIVDRHGKTVALLPAAGGVWRFRTKVEEVAPVHQELPHVRVQATPTPNAFGTKASQPLKGTSANPDSLGKAPVAAKGKAPAAAPVVGAAGTGTGGGIGIGSAIPGLKATAGIQGGFGLISDLDSNFPFAWYIQQIQSRITGNWNRLSSAQGRVQVYFRINKDGTLEGLRVESPSGNGALDQSALLAVRRSDPLPKLPDGDSLGVRFWFIYLGN